MNYTRKVMKDIFWLGGNDRRLALFENLYPIPRGISYNAYLVRDEKNTLFDTVDHAVSDLFLENLAQALAGEPLHFVVVQHMEPDHCAALGEVLRRYPEAGGAVQRQGGCDDCTVFCGGFSRAHPTVKEGEALETGRHRFLFLMAPMVHWPEVMVSLEEAGEVSSFRRTPSACSARSTGRFYGTLRRFRPRNGTRRAGITRTSWANTVRRCRRF